MNYVLDQKLLLDKLQKTVVYAQIKSKLFVGDNVKATDVKVITENGEVFLLGNVTQSQGDSAAEIASKVTGVQKVVKVFKYLN